MLTLSVEAFQFKVKDVVVTLDAATFDGAVGDCVSGVVTVTVLLATDVFPAASFATI